MSSSPGQFLVRGRVIAAHGIRGMVRAVLSTDFPERVLEADELTLRSPGGAVTTYKLEQGDFYKAGVLLKLGGVDDRDAADGLRGAELVASADELPPLGDGEYYWHQLIGLAVVTVDGETVGTITEILRTGSNDVYVTERAPRRPGPLIPDIKDVIERVDLAAGVVLIKPLPGLLDL